MSKHYSKIAVLLLALLTIGVNLLAAWPNYRSALTKNIKQLKEPGYQYKDIRPYLKNIERIEYVTDRESSLEKGTQHLLFAQHMLAPTVLDVNNANLRYILLDCTSLEAAFQRIRTLKAKPVFINRYNKILAEKI